jgi:hypothetical protein
MPDHQTPPGSTETEEPPSVDQTATDKEQVAFIAKQATAAFLKTRTHLSRPQLPIPLPSNGKESASDSTRMAWVQSMSAKNVVTNEERTHITSLSAQLSPALN